MLAPPAPATPAPASPETGGGAAAPTTTTRPKRRPPQRARVEGVLTAGTAGSPVAGAPVIVQARTVTERGEAVKESTLAEVQTGQQGQWAAQVPPPAKGELALRALFPGGHSLGATVSEGVSLPAPKAA